MRPPVETIPNGAYGRLKEPRRGVMLHYDASTSDAGSRMWFKDPRCRVSYNYLVLDNGDYVVIAPLDKRAWHAGYCRGHFPDRYPDAGYRDANSAFYSVSAAARPGDRITKPQLATIAELVKYLCNKHKWELHVPGRLVTHKSEACFKPSHPKAGQLGRKVDPDALFTRADVLGLLS